jgi:hypothetical protein
MIEWTCKAQRVVGSEMQHQDEVRVLEYAIQKDDMDLLQFIMEIIREQKSLLAEEEDDQRSYTRAFYTAIRLGRTTILAELIKVSTSSGLNFLC